MQQVRNGSNLAGKLLEEPGIVFERLMGVRLSERAS